MLSIITGLVLALAVLALAVIGMAAHLAMPTGQTFTGHARRFHSHVFPKFLATFAAFASTASKNIARGPSSIVPIFVEHELAQALGAADTLALTMPAGLDFDYVPVLLEVMSPSATGVRTSKKSLLSVTSFSKLTGVVTFTSSGVIAITSNILLQLTPASDTAAA